MDPKYCSYTLNWEPNPRSLRVRNGVVRHCVIPDGFAPAQLLASGSKLFAYCLKTANNARIYDITTSTPSLAYTLGGVGGPLSCFNFAGSSAIVGTIAGASVVYDGSSWGDMGFTKGGTGINPRVGCSYKGRVYLGTTPTLIYYSALAGVTGACTNWDLSTVFRKTGNVNVIASLSPPTNKLDDQMLVVGLDAGEVLVYAGDNPGASNWQLVAHFDLPELRGYNPFLSFNNDIWIITKNGLFSVRALFQYDASDLERISPSFIINSDITTLQSFSTSTAGGPHSSLTFSEDKSLVYLGMYGYVNNAGTRSAGISIWTYNILSKAWTYSRNVLLDIGGKSLTYFGPEKTIFFPNYFIDSVVYKISNTVFYDEDAAGDDYSYSYALHSAYFDLGSGQTKHVHGWEPLIRTDFAGADVTMKTATDFGRKVSAASSNALLAAGGYQAPTYNVGGQGSYFQYRIEGNSTQAATVGLELYSVGAIVT